jgi:hypothetical protein
MALRDELTGLLNRPQLREESSLIISQTAGRGETCGYLVAAIDQAFWRRGISFPLPKLWGWSACSTAAR